MADEATSAAQEPPPPPAAVDPTFIAKFQAMETKLGALLAEKEAAAKTHAETERAELLRKGELDTIKKNHDAEVKALKDDNAAIKQRSHASELKRTLIEALSGHDLREGVMGQLLKLWSDDFRIDEEGEGFVVRSKSDLREPKAVFAERLGSKEFDHFLKAGHRGGSGVGGDQGRKAAETQTQANPFQFVAQQMREKYMPQKN